MERIASEKTRKALVSIIVPVYNADKYLHKCIGSIRTQSYANWELILIDDGSQDSSPEICEHYQSEDERIVFLRKDNSGVSDTRNVGIACSKGEYICFVDADDWIESKYLEHLMSFSKYDYVIAGYKTWPERSKCILREQFYNREEMPLMFDKYLQTRPTSCATLFNADIIKDHSIQFISKLRSREDHLFNVQYLRWCNSACVINFQEYVVRSRRVPIAIKFRMHSDDIIHVIDSLLTGYREIEEAYGYKPKEIRQTLKIMNQYYLDDFTYFKNDDDYFRIYRNYFNNAIKEDMYADIELNSMNLIIDGILAYRQVHNYRKMQELIDTFRYVFQDTSINCSLFRNKLYKRIAVSILRQNSRMINRGINYQYMLNMVSYYLKSSLRPVMYGLNSILNKCS